MKFHKINKNFKLKLNLNILKKIQKCLKCKKLIGQELKEK